MKNYFEIEITANPVNKEYLRDIKKKCDIEFSEIFDHNTGVTIRTNCKELREVIECLKKLTYDGTKPGYEQSKQFQLPNFISELEKEFIRNCTTNSVTITESNDFK